MAFISSSFSKYRNQFLAVFCANIATVCFGCGLGWLSPALLLLRSDEESPLPSGSVTVDDASWMGSMVYLVSMFGFLVVIPISNRFGRKMVMMSLIIPMIVTWLLVIFATNPIYLYFSRFVIGIVVSGAYICIPLMVAEIADDQVRGILGAMISAGQYLGILIAYIVGALVPYDIVPYCMLALPVVYIVTIVFIPETPVFLLKTNRRKEAEESLKFFKNCGTTSKEDVERFNEELNKLLIFVEKTSSSVDTVKLADFFTPKAIQAFLMSAYMMFLMAYSGSVVLLTYGATIFSETGSDFDPNTSTIIMGSVQLSGTLSAIILIDKFGRRILYMVSTTGSTLGLLCVGIYTYLAKNDYELHGLSWVPVTCISLALYCVCIGIIPVTIVLMAELLPAKIRSVGSMICLFMMSVSLFSAVKIFPIVNDVTDLYVSLWFFSGTCFTGLLYSVFILKETKGKNINVDN